MRGGFTFRLVPIASALLLTAAQPVSRIPSENLAYLGAFRLPAGDPSSEIRTWSYGGHAMTCYPAGDPSGPDDGFPGSIFAVGHAWAHLVAEIDIPVPALSPGRDPGGLPRARTLQAFTDILDVSSLEIPRTGLAWLPAQPGQASDKLHFCWGFHMQEEPPALTHGWCERDLSDPRARRGWALGGLPVHLRNMSTNDYLCALPPAWADRHTPGMGLATGRFRDGGWSGRGPSLFAIGPWNHGDPPATGTEIGHVPLLRYASSVDESEDPAHALDGYHHSDEWSGAAWLTAGEASAFVVAGTKGYGDCWYGNQDGPGLDVENRGWWSDEFRGVLLFYDTDDLAASASGRLAPWQPQPYAVLEIDDRLFGVTSVQQKHHLGACDFDRENGLLYVFELFGDGDKPLIHVWRVPGPDDPNPAGRKKIVIRR